MERIMKEQELIDELKKIQDFFFENKHYESSNQITLAIDTIEDLFSNKEWYEYDSMHEVRRMIREELSKLDLDSPEETERIRVSCAGLASIVIDGKYLLVQNKSARDKGVLSYGPVGGALEYYSSAEPFLETLNATMERETPDLRMMIDADKLGEFSSWFKARKDRETTAKREVYEELVEEEGILSSLSDSDMQESLVDTKIERGERDGVVSERFFEIYKITFSPAVEDELKRIAAEDSTVELFTKEEIMSGAHGISSHSKAIL
jgi:hypothetical protein